ncbi:hypothetical protein FPSE_01644 [Fusarium pseudograminearum CS3096]|uniref:Uncharacterized protein n=1 Tax=Fusarium pseudograminearum (strain CS3096) TaxID=1028729 RepID=K3VV40_FUSPC|nr:hypothetical protein FPSE_01644 [Fusarium pseudograminearum CS3096]EKJ78183.1 hypothetical protein FPSE_01644 [Fusarium pseudograminearum CS3096]
MYISAALVAIKCPPKSLPWAFHRQRTCPQQSSKLGGPPFLLHEFFRYVRGGQRLRENPPLNSHPETWSLGFASFPRKPPLRPQEATVWVFTAYLKGKAAWSRVFDSSSGRAQDQAVLPFRSSCLAFQVCCGGRGLCCEEDHVTLGRLSKYPEELLKPHVDTVFDSIIDRDTPDGVVSDSCEYTMLHIAAHKLMYDTIEKLNELGAKWLYVKNWLNQVVLLFRYAVMVHRLCKRPWMALDLTGNSTLSQRVLGSNVDLDCHYSDGIPKDAAYMEYDLGYAASAVVSQTRNCPCRESDEICLPEFQAAVCELVLNGGNGDMATKVIDIDVVSSLVTGRRLSEVVYVSMTLVDMGTGLDALCKLRDPRGNTCEAFKLPASVEFRPR